MHLHYFNTTNTHPTLLINQERERRWLLEALTTFLSLPDRNQGKTWAVIGEKGMGKSILTRAVLQEIRETYSSDTLVVDVDCRHRRSWREVLAEFARNPESGSSSRPSPPALALSLSAKRRPSRR